MMANLLKTQISKNQEVIQKINQLRIIEAATTGHSIKVV